jgi:hypothetical protein
MVSTSGGSNSSSSIIIKKPPTKRKYYEGERLNLQGMEVWLYQTGKSPVKIDTFTTIPAANTELTRYDSSILIQYQTSEIEYLHTNLNISILYPVALQEMIPPGVDRGVGKYKLNTSEAKYVMEYNDGSIKEIPNENLTTNPSNTEYTEGTIAADKYLNYTIIADGIKFMNRMYTVPQNVVNNIKICTFASGTWEEIGKLMRQNDAGELTLTNYWKVGDERKERINEKMYTMVILDLNKTSTGGTKYNAAIGFKELMDFDKYDKYDTPLSLSGSYKDIYFNLGENHNLISDAQPFGGFDLNRLKNYMSTNINLNNNGLSEVTNSVQTGFISNAKLQSKMLKSINDIAIQTTEAMVVSKIECRVKVPTMENLNKNLTVYAKTDIMYSPRPYTGNDRVSIQAYYLSCVANTSKAIKTEKSYYHIYSSENMIGNVAFEYYKTSSNRIKTLNDTPTEYYLNNCKLFNDNITSEYTYSYNGLSCPNNRYTSGGDYIYNSDSSEVQTNTMYVINLERSSISTDGSINNEYASKVPQYGTNSSKPADQVYTSSFFCI